MITLTRTVLALAITASVVAQPHASDAATVAECTSRQLAASYTGGDGAAGTIYGRIALTNVSARSCYVRGFGGLSYVGRGNGTQVGPAAARDTSKPAGVVILGVGDSARSRVGEAQTANYVPSDCQPVHVDGFRVYAPDSRVATFVVHPTTACSSRVPGHQLFHQAYR